MKAYRIGRKPIGPWTNRTPPIRGGIFHARAQSDISPDDSDLEMVKEKESVDEGYGSAASHRSGTGTPEPEFASGRESSPSPERAALRARTGYSADNASSVHDGKADVADSAIKSAQLALSPDEWTEWAIQQDKNVDVRDYPPVDTAVQQEITSKYRQLHKRVQDAGLYACPYTEYGKEMARYTALFAGFVVAVRAEWYMTSAIFLGLFWVRIYYDNPPPYHSMCFLFLFVSSPPCVRILTTANDSTKSCSRPMMPAIEPSHPISPLTA